MCHLFSRVSPLVQSMTGSSSDPGSCSGRHRKLFQTRPGGYGIGMISCTSPFELFRNIAMSLSRCLVKLFRRLDSHPIVQSNSSRSSQVLPTDGVINCTISAVVCKFRVATTMYKELEYERVEMGCVYLLGKRTRMNYEHGLNERRRQIVTFCPIFSCG